jgi:hypothetical protein
VPTQMRPPGRVKSSRRLTVFTRRPHLGPGQCFRVHEPTNPGPTESWTQSLCHQVKEGMVKWWQAQMATRRMETCMQATHPTAVSVNSIQLVVHRPVGNCEDCVTSSNQPNRIRHTNRRCPTEQSVGRQRWMSLSSTALCRRGHRLRQRGSLQPTVRVLGERLQTDRRQLLLATSMI